MLPAREWLKPPRSLLAILFLLTLVSVSTLGWFGWKLLEQERSVESQRARERLEQAAERIAATLRSALAETGERLGGWLVSPPGNGEPQEGVLLVMAGSGLTSLPAGRLLYRPLAGADPEAAPGLFAEGEAIEFQQGEAEKAIAWYQRLAASPNAAVRAGALMRRARVLLRMGRSAPAAECYRELASMGGVRVAGVPAELVARHALCDLSGAKQEAEGLRRDLLGGRWPLTRGQFLFYWSEASRLAGRTEGAPEAATRLAEAARQAWGDLNPNASVRGERILWVDSAPYLLIWRGVSGRLAALVTKPESILKPDFSGQGLAYAVVDAEGRAVAGKRYGAALAAVRTPVEGQLPWALYVTGREGSKDAGMLARQRFLLMVMAVMVLFLVAGTYFVGRAIRRELEVSRMQSEFVSAVSHEFRSPLTSMRQLSEILALGRVPGEERRQVYYETLVRETKRLQRLVEALLNFGRMEAGVRQYRFEELETAALVERVAAEFESQIAGSGRQIELDGAREHCVIDADPEALSVALRNLVDNALKYSPDCPTVWVRWGMENSHVAIRVRDQGMGIPVSERKAIFRKFVRGSAAAAANVKGSGVGLAMVRHIVAAHRGQITVESAPGQGSTFTIFLPAGTERA